MRWVLSFLGAIALWSLIAAHAGGQEKCPQDKYSVEVPTHRWALVIGNSNYTNIDPLPSAIEEAHKVAAALGGLGFEVTEDKDVTFDKFKQLLDTFVAKIQPDDLVIFYFSGHGFNYGNENYLVPVGFPAHVTDIEVPVTFIPVTSLVQRIIGEKRPGYLLLLLDACRTAAQFDAFKKGFDDSTSGRASSGAQSPSTKDDVNAGLIDQQRSLGNYQSTLVNYQYLYAASPGHPAASGNQPGPFAMALVGNLPLADREFSDLEKDIARDVEFATRSQNLPQLPFLSGNSTAEIYFRPGEERLNGERVLWDSARCPTVRPVPELQLKAVFAFRRRYSVSRFVHAARQWLEDNGQPALASLTRVSPLALEQAWRNPAENPGTVTLARFEGPLAFPKNSLTADATEKAISTPEVTTTGKTNRSAKAVADIFAKYGKAVVTGPLTVVDGASRGAKPLAELKSGTKLTILGSESREPNQAWLQVVGPGIAGVAYLPLSGSSAIGATNIGKPLKEISVGPLAGGIQGLTDPAPVIDGLRDLRAAGRSVERISISTPKAQEEGARELFTLRVAHLMHALDLQGVPRGRISVAGEDPMLSQDRLRIRIYGN